MAAPGYDEKLSNQSKKKKFTMFLLCRPLLYNLHPQDCFIGQDDSKCTGCQHHVLIDKKGRVTILNEQLSYSSFSKTQATFLLITHWPELIHMIIPSCCDLLVGCIAAAK